MELRRARPRRPRRRALTLIEMLTVIVIIGLAAGTALLRLGPLHEENRLRSAAAAIHEIDGRARLHALSGRRIEMQIEDSSGEVRLVALGSGETLAVHRLARGTLVQLTVPLGRSGPVFDRTGRSADYAVKVSLGEHVLRWRTCGMTGRVRKEGEQ